MNRRLSERLQQLEAEHAAGQKMLAELDVKRQGLAATMLRIEGAIEVLKELMATEAGDGTQDHSGADA